MKSGCAISSAAHRKLSGHYEQKEVKSKNRLDNNRAQFFSRSLEFAHRRNGRTRRNGESGSAQPATWFTMRCFGHLAAEQHWSLLNIFEELKELERSQALSRKIRKLHQLIASQNPVTFRMACSFGSQERRRRFEFLLQHHATQVTRSTSLLMVTTRRLLLKSGSHNGNDFSTGHSRHLPTILNAVLCSNLKSAFFSLSTLQFGLFSPQWFRLCNHKCICINIIRSSARQPDLNGILKAQSAEYLVVTLEKKGEANNQFRKQYYYGGIRSFPLSTYHRKFFVPDCVKHGFVKGFLFPFPGH